jgi:hypothetical protein
MAPELQSLSNRVLQPTFNAPPLDKNANKMGKGKNDDKPEDKS